METVRPVTDLVGGGNGTNPPVPCNALVESGCWRVCVVTQIEACIIPRSGDLQIR